MKSVMVGLILLLATASLHAQPPIQPRWVKTGHYGGIAGMAFAPDGRYLASMGSSDERILLWDTKSRTTVPRAFAYPPGRSGSSYGGLAYSPDGTRLVAAIAPGIFVWDVSSGMIVDSIKTFAQAVVLIQLSMSGDSIAWLSAPNLMVRYDLKSHSVIDTLILIGANIRPQWPRLTDFSISQDLQTIAYPQSGYDSVIVYSYVARLSHKITEAPHPGNPVLSSDGKRLAISGIAGCSVIDLVNSSVLRAIPGSYSMTPIQFTGTGDTLIYADSLLVQMNLSTGDSVVLGVWPSSNNSQNLYCRQVGMIAQQTTDILYSGYPVNGSIALTDLSGHTGYELTGTQGGVQVIWSPNSDLLTESSGGIMKSFRADDATLTARAGDWSIIGFDDISYSWDGSKIATSVVYYDEMQPNDYVGYLSASNLSPMNTLCSNVSYWNVGHGGSGYYKPFQLFLSPQGTPFVMDNYIVDTPCRYRDSVSYSSVYGFSPDGATLLAGDERDLVAIDVATMLETKILGMGAMPIRWARFTEDGSAIMVAHTDSTLEFLSYPSLTRIHLFGSNSLPIVNASLSKNGRYILSSATDSTLRVWDVNSESVIYTYPKYSSPLTAVGFSYDQKYVAATDGGTSIIVWNAPSNLSVLSSSPNPESFLLQNSPNPVTTQTTITFSLPFSEEIDIRLFDAMGREVSILSSGRMSAGEHEIRVGPEVVKSLGAGVYYYRLHSVSGTETKRMVIK